MKLFPVVAATLLQESSAACNGDPVFSVTCHEDLVVELTVNKDCLKEKFEFVSITELQINPTDATGTVPTSQCLPCTSLPCSESTQFMAYDFSEDNPNEVEVDNESTSLFFKAGQCGTTMEISNDKTKAIFKTEIGKPAEIDELTKIVTEATLLETDITCEYPSTITNIDMDAGMTIIADASQDSDKISQDENPDAVSDSLFEMTTRERTNGVNGAEITSTDDVTLGDGVSIEVKALDDAITDFYLGDCIADNGQDQFLSDGVTKNDDFRSLKIVTGGCMEDLGSLTTDISASMTGTELIFKQFAFADQSKEALTLEFQVTCDIILGEKPDDTVCTQRKADNSGSTLTGLAGRRRRADASDASGYTETTEYKVTAGNKIAEVSDDGIVVAHSGAGKATDNNAESGAVSTTIAFMAGTAVMFL